MEGFSHSPSKRDNDEDWDPAATWEIPSILCEHVWCDLAPDIDQENLTWIRLPDQSASENSDLNDCPFPCPDEWINQYVFSTAAIRDTVTARRVNTRSEKPKDIATALIATRLDNDGNPLNGCETTLQKFIHLFRPYIITTSKYGCANTGTTVIKGISAGRNLDEIILSRVPKVQTQLRVPSAHLSCMPQCDGEECTIFLVVDTDYSICATGIKRRPHGMNNCRYVVAPTTHEHLVHSYESEIYKKRAIKRDTKPYPYEIAIRRIAIISKFGDGSLVKIDPITVGVPEYTVDIGNTWYHKRHVWCLDEDPITNTQEPA